MKRCRRWLVGGGLALIALSSGTAAASGYPPGDPTPSTVASGGVAGVAGVSSGSSSVSGIRQPDVELAATGSDTDTTLLVAGGAIAAGAGLLVAARVRRSAPAA